MFCEDLLMGKEAEQPPRGKGGKVAVLLDISGGVNIILRLLI